MEQMQQPVQMTPQQRQKIINDLTTSEAKDLDSQERSLLSEHQGFVENMSRIDSQVRSLQDKIEDMSKHRTRMEGIAEYVFNKAIQYRAEKMQAAAREVAASKPKSGADPAEIAKTAGKEKGSENSEKKVEVGI